MNHVFRNIFTAFFCFTFSVSTYCQTQTVGIFLNKPEAYNGYTLLMPSADSTTYLLDNCGRIVHTWKSVYRPGLSAYLLADGTLLRPTRVPTTVFKDQAGGRVEKVDWDGNVIWEYKYSNNQHHQHHDITVMPNGNVLLLAFEFKSFDEAVANGRNPETAKDGMWAEHIVEVQPIGKDSGKIVWEWHSWDHLIQEKDNSKSNYGKVSDHPELLDLNYPPDGNHDWLHGNAIAYNAEYDQIVISARMQSEIYIIDHSTTRSEAAGHTGGKRNKGGDILYRWGNPQAYGRGSATDQQFFFQHNAHWISDGLRGAGRLMVFNNGIGRPGGNFSSIDEIELPVDKDGNYTSPGTGTFLPQTVSWRYMQDTLTNFYSNLISSAQRLPNGNTLICEGVKGKIFEIDSAGKKVWQYVNPVTNSGIVSQGTAPANNNVFRAYKYGENYPAFKGKTLTPQGYIEKNPGAYNCTIFKDSSTIGISENYNLQKLLLYPNPAENALNISYTYTESATLYLYSYSGKEMLAGNIKPGTNTYKLDELKPGIYFCRIINYQGKKICSQKIVKL